MREVAIIGIGQTPVDEHWDKSLKELAGEAIFAALNDAGRETAEALYIGNMLSGILSKQENLGALVSDWIGLPGMEAEKVEAACGSGAAAFRAGLMAVGSQEVDSALVVGVEKMTESLPIETTEALATAADADYESAQGLSFVAINALVMQLYLHTYGWNHTDFAPFSINAHANALHNPFARLHEAITQADYVNARMVAAPINLLDASPTGDGAAALLLVPAESLASYDKPVVKVVGSASATDSIAIHSRKDPLWLSAAEKSAKKAYVQAGIGPAQVDFFELHDAFSIMSVLSLEACGFSERGQAPALGLDG
ncbi:MAG: thiolase C-terminal domain-containing protein, partial [Acidobacteriaceae bacterium]